MHPQSSVEYTYNDHAQNPDPPHQPFYLKKMLQYLRRGPSIMRVLDAGCGDGNFAASLASAGFEMYGVDLSKSGIEIAEGRKVGRFARSSIYDSLTAPFPGVEHFDAIVTVETIEHLYSPRVFVARLYEALKPGGILIVTCPYWGYLKNIALAVTGRMDGVLSALWDGGHIKHWSRKTLTSLMTEAGFEELAFYGAGRRPPYLWAGMMMMFRKPE